VHRLHLGLRAAGAGWPMQVSWGYQAEVLGSDQTVPVGQTIENLLVTVKAHQTAEAVARVKARLTKDSNVFLLQNGMGVEREVIECLLGRLPPEGLPRIIPGITNHGCRRLSSAPFSLLHNTIPGAGEASFSEAPLAARAALTSLEQLSALNVHIRPCGVMERLRREKLLVNCCINPLTALLGCQNGDLLGNPHSMDLMTEVCREGVAVLSTLDRSGGWDADRSLAAALLVASITAENRSSMLQDFDRGLGTEIQYMNGYLVRAAQELGLPAPVNNTLLHLVLARTAAATCLC